MGKEEFYNLKSTLASIEKMEHRLQQLTKSKDKPEIVDANNPMSLFDVERELDTEPETNNLDKFHENKLKLEREIFRIQKKLTNCETTLELKESQLEESEGYWEPISEEIESSKEELKSVISEISELEVEHLDGEDWKKFKSRVYEDKASEISSKTIQPDDSGEYPTSLTTIFFIIGVVVGFILIFGSGYEYECYDGERISATFIDDGTEDCTDGDDEWKSAKEYRNVGYEVFACCGIPLGLAVIGQMAGNYRAERVNAKIDLKVMNLMNANDHKYGDVLKKLAKLERKKNTIQNRIQDNKNEANRMKKLPKVVDELKQTVEVYRGQIEKATEKLDQLVDTYNTEVKELESDINSAWLSIKDLIPYSDKLYK